MGKLEAKIALVTGGNSDIGLATAKQFVSEGAYVFTTGRRGGELDAAAREIGRNITAVQVDASNLNDLDGLFAQIKREKDRLDIVFANAGAAKYAPLGSITEELYDSIFDINVKGHAVEAKDRVDSNTIETLTCRQLIRVCGAPLDKAAIVFV